MSDFSRKSKGISWGDDPHPKCLRFGGSGFWGSGVQGSRFRGSAFNVPGLSLCLPWVLFVDPQVLDGSANCSSGSSRVILRPEIQILQVWFPAQRFSESTLNPEPLNLWTCDGTSQSIARRLFLSFSGTPFFLWNFQMVTPPKTVTPKNDPFSSPIFSHETREKSINILQNNKLYESGNPPLFSDKTRVLLNNNEIRILSKNIQKMRWLWFPSISHRVLGCFHGFLSGKIPVKRI